MANPNTPRGLQPYAYAWGAPWGGAVRTYYVPAGNATALFLGDPVQLVGGSSDGNGVPTAEIATAGGTTSPTDYILGAFMGISNNAGQATITLLQNQTPYLAAGQAAYIYVADDPFLLFEMQEDSVGGAMPSYAAGGNAALVAGAGSTVTSFSGWQLQSSTIGAASQQMRIIQALQQVDNAVGVNAKWLTKINLHQMLNTTGFN